MTYYCFVADITLGMRLRNGLVILLLSIWNLVDSNPDVLSRLQALESRAEKSERKLERLRNEGVTAEKRVHELERELEQLRNAVDSGSFFSVQFSDTADIGHGDIMDFDVIIVNYGDDYIQSGGLYV